MIEAHIMDGDLVLVRKQETAGSGDIVAAMLDGEATVKRFAREGGAVVLQPGASDHEADRGGGRTRRTSASSGKVIGIMRQI